MVLSRREGNFDVRAARGCQHLSLKVLGGKIPVRTAAPERITSTERTKLVLSGTGQVPAWSTFTGQNCNISATCHGSESAF